MEEVFMPIEGYEGLYEVSNFGRIKSLERLKKLPGKNQGFKIKEEQILKNRVNKSGYVVASLCKNGKVKVHLVHRLVLIAFVPNPLKKKCVNHIDSNRSNNMISNLEWVTHSENSKHAYEYGFKEPIAIKGVRHYRSTFSIEDIHAIRSMIRSKKSVVYIASVFNVTESAISGVKFGRTWRHLPCKL